MLLRSGPPLEDGVVAGSEHRGTRLLEDRPSVGKLDRADRGVVRDLASLSRDPLLRRHPGASLFTLGGGSRPHEDELFMRINCLGPLWLTRLLLPGMLDRGYGKIVMMSSVDGGIAVFPSFRDADGMSKAAVAFLTRQLAAQHTHSPVDIFCLCPGATDTPMFRASTLDGLSPADHQSLTDRLPAGRLIDPAEIAETVRWLASSHGRVLHGAVIDASLGLGAHPGLLTGRPATPATHPLPA